MKVKIKGEEIELIYGIRTNILYESIMNTPLKIEELNRTDKMAYLFYANILATVQAKKLNIDFSWDDFINFLDTNYGMKILGDYAVWLTEKLTAQAQLINDSIKGDNDTKKPAKKKS